jgi:hypothetical protein
MSIADFYHTVISGVKSELGQAAQATAAAGTSVQSVAYTLGNVKTVEEAHALAVGLAQHAATILKASEHMGHVGSVLAGPPREGVT